MDLREVEEMTLRFSLGDVKAALGEIRERLDDIRAGEVHYRHSGEELHLITHRSPVSGTYEESDLCVSGPSLAESESMMSVRSLRRKEWSLKGA